MEKQRNESGTESGRRLLKKLTAASFVFLWIFGRASVFGQTLTNAMLRELRINPAADQLLTANSDIKFEVLIPYTKPGQIEITLPEEKDNIQFKTLRKVESGENGGGTKIEMWFSFAKTGTYALTPLTVKIKNSRRQIPFTPVKIGINPKEQEPLCLIITDSGINKNITVTAGQKIKFRICLQYAVQLLQFSWELPKDSLFTQTRVYEFTEIKQREKVVSDELIPVSDFEWTPLLTGLMDFPKFNIQAVAYNGDKITVRLPQIKVNVVKGQKPADREKPSFLTQSFEQNSEDLTVEEKNELSADDALQLAKLRSRERHSIRAAVRKERVAFEKLFALPYNQKEFKVFWIYLCIFLLLAFIVLFVINVRKKRSLLNMGMGLGILLILIALIYSIVCGGKKYGISIGAKMFSIPEASASIKSELPAGSRVQLLNESDGWYRVSFGEAEGWCHKEEICEIK